MSPLSVSKNLTWNAIYFITTDIDVELRENEPIRSCVESKLKDSKMDEKMKTLKLTLWLRYDDSELLPNQQPNMKAHV